MTSSIRATNATTYPSKFIDVLGSKIHYIEAGVGDPILFLHGIPTSCYLWRNIIPYLQQLGHCIAPDLIGFGKSDKPDIAYTIFDHIKYIENFIEALQLKNVVLVMHGWGSIIGCHYAQNNMSNVKGLVFYEAFLRPMNGEDNSLPFQEQMLTLQEQHDLSLNNNGVTFVDKFIQPNVMRHLNEEEIESYREPFLSPGTQKPILQYLKEIPNEKNNQINQLIKQYADKLSKSNVPKLMLYAVPGFITTIATVMWAKENLPNLEVVDLGEEYHLAQESNPELIAETISIWLQGIENV